MTKVNLEPPTVDHKKSAEEDTIHVLHVDDEAGFLKCAKQILEMQGSFEVETAASVEEAQEKMRKKEFDVIVSDYQMPIKDGLEFLKELRDNGNNIPFILFTGKGREEVTINALNLGADRYFNKIGKPETVYGELAHALLQVVEKKRVEQSLSERVKELRCLYGISRLTEQTNMTLDEILQRTVNLLLHAWQNPDIACARIVFENREFKTKNFKETRWKQQVDLKMYGKKVGVVTLGYLEEKPTITKSQFLKEERTLIDAVAERLAIIIERKEAEEKLQASEKSWSDSFSSLEDVMVIIDKDFTIEKMNDSGLKLLGKTREEVTGKKCYQTIHGLDAPCEFCPYERTLKTGKLESVDRYIELFDKYFSIKSSPLFNERGEIVGFVDLMRDVTEKKKAEAALRESEEKYRELLNGMNDTAWVIDFDCNLMDVNDAAVEVMGYSREELLSMGLTGIDSNLNPEEIKGLVEGMPADEIQVFETVHTTKDGTTIPVEISSSLITYHGKPAILSIARNITERKQAEELFKNSQEQLKAIILNAPIGIATSDTNMFFLSANEAFCRILGFSEDELRKLTFKDVTHPDDVKVSIVDMEELIFGRVPFFSHEKRYIRKDGTTINGKVTVSAIRDKEGKPVLFIAELEDISKRKKAEEALVQEQDKLESVTAAIGAGLVIISKDYHVLWANDFIRQYKGDTIGKLCYATLNSLDAPCPDCGVTKIFAGKTTLDSHEYYSTTIDGKPYWVEIVATPITDENGNVISAVEIAVDITERKEAEKKLDEMMNELALVNEKLGVVGKLTRHDVRNKLSVIVNNVYLAKQRLAGDQVGSRYLEDVESAVNQAEKIFDFANTYEKMGVEELSYVDVGKSFDAAVTLHADLSGIEVVNDCSGVNVLSDSLLDTLFYNLIDNSIKHGENVSRIGIHCKTGKDSLKLVYEDNGVGVSASEKEHIFKEGYRNTGLGLVMIKKMCNIYGWTIQETGKPGKGAQLTMNIPKTNKNGKIAYTLD